MDSTDRTGVARTGAPHARRGAWLRVAAMVLGGGAIAVSAFLLWATTPLGPDAIATDTLTTDTLVRVRETAWGWEFTPAGSAEPTRGVVFYPGGRVDARSYARLCRRIARRGVLVSLVRMPLSLAVADPDAADAVLQAHPGVRTWVVGGHSLGGAMAAQYAAGHTSRVDGLFLLASYPPPSTDLHSLPIEVASAWGARDAVVADGAISTSRESLPEDTVWVEIDGGNHAQFGDYGAQPGDTTATIPPAAQQEHAAAVIAGVVARAARR